MGTAGRTALYAKNARLLAFVYGALFCALCGSASPYAYAQNAAFYAEPEIIVDCDFAAVIVNAPVPIEIRVLYAFPEQIDVEFPALPPNAELYSGSAFREASSDGDSRGTAAYSREIIFREAGVYRLDPILVRFPNGFRVYELPPIEVKEAAGGPQIWWASLPNGAVCGQTIELDLYGRNLPDDYKIEYTIPENVYLQAPFVRGGSSDFDSDSEALVAKFLWTPLVSGKTDLPEVSVYLSERLNSAARPVLAFTLPALSVTAGAAEKPEKTGAGIPLALRDAFDPAYKDSANGAAEDSSVIKTIDDGGGGFIHAEKYAAIAFFGFFALCALLFILRIVSYAAFKGASARSNLSVRRIVLSGACALLNFVLSLFFYRAYVRAYWICAPECYAYAVPDETAEKVFYLADGIEVRAESRSERWIYARTASGAAGWVLVKTVRQKAL